MNGASPTVWPTRPWRWASCCNVIPGWSEGPDPESRDSGSGPSDHPGMTLQQLAHRHGRVGHTVGEAPFIVVPRHHPHQVAVHDLGLVHVEGRGMRVVVEVD